MLNPFASENNTHRLLLRVLLTAVPLLFIYLFIFDYIRDLSFSMHFSFILAFMCFWALCLELVCIIQVLNST